MRYAGASIAMLAGLAMMSTASARDLGPIEKAYETFNEAAEKSDLDIRATQVRCSADKANVCTIKISGNVGALASSSTTDHSRAQDFTILMGRDTDPVSFLGSIIIAMVAWSPESGPKERGKALRLLTAKLKAKKKGEAILGSTRYKLMPLEMAGIWLTVEPI